MERRIKIVWIFSIVAMLLITAGQGYWLRNQYHYVIDERVNEVYNCILRTVQLNDSVRALQPRKVFNSDHTSYYNIDFKTEEPDRGSIAKVLLVATTKAEKSDTFALVRPNMKYAVTVSEPEAVYCDSFRIKLPSWYSVNIASAIELCKLEVDVPFTLQRFDSLFAGHMGSLPFTTHLKVANDTVFQWEPTMKRSGTLLCTNLQVHYPYNPLKHQLLVVSVDLAPSALLIHMGWQLLGSFCLILLLGFCLLFQIKTILKQRRTDELRKSFVNTMIHELKRPVQVLKMCVAFLNDKVLRTDEKAMDEVIHDSMSELDNLSAYLSKLRDMTRADDEFTQLSVRTFDIKDTVDKFVRLYHTSENKSVSMDAHFSKETLVTADPIHISNIIGNLIENAVKYSGQSVHIVIDCLLLGHKLMIRVTDNGIGIPAAEQSRVFDKFYRGSNIPDYSLPGIGLGLSYVRLLVEAHRGTISLNSQPGEGTEIEISIPQ